MAQIRRVCLVAFAAMAGAQAAYATGRLSFIAGAEYSTGDYGSPSDTEVFYEFVSARYTNAPWSFKVTVPFLQVDGPASVAGDEGEVELLPGVDRSASGIGDVSLSTTYTFAWQAERTYLDLIGRVRLPTGDEDEGLGSGETDFIAIVGLTKDFADISAFVEAGRRFLGSSLSRPRQDGWLVSAGISAPLGGGTEIGAAVDWREASYDGQPDPAEVSASVRFNLSDDVRMNVYAFAGLSDGSPDGGAGLTLTWRALTHD